MLKTRIIPCLFLKNGFLVRSEQFSFHQLIGNGLHQTERFTQWSVDELIYVDITPDDSYDIRRDDMKVKNISSFMDIIKEVSKVCFVPLSVGGKVRSIADIRERLKIGADKVIINSHAIKNPQFINEAANVFGSQCIVIAIDYKHNGYGNYECFTDNGRSGSGKNPVEWAKEAEERGAGEIFLNSIERDGMAEGYDLELTRQVSKITNIPVITCGGAGDYKDFAAAITEGKASAAAGGNIFHFRENCDRQIKKTIKKLGINVRLEKPLKVSVL